MKLYKRSDTPTLYAEMLHPRTGRRLRFSTGHTERMAAQAAAMEHLASLTRVTNDTVDGMEPITIADALTRYVVALRTKASVPAMRSRALKLTKRHPRFPTRFGFEPTRYLHTLTPADLAMLVEARQQEGLSPQTIAHDIALLRAATRYVATVGFRSPTLMINGQSRNPWRVPKVPQKTRYLSIDEFRAVYKHMDPDQPIMPERKDGTTMALYVPTGAPHKDRQDAQDLLVILAMTGGRWSEVTALEWPHVDIEGGTVTLWGNKTQASRVVPMPDLAKDVFKRRAASFKRAPKGFVFPGRKGKQRGPSSCQPIVRAMDACGLNTPEVVAKHGRATPHSLRHTFASMLVQGGEQLNRVRLALGHTTLTMTQRYAHLEQHDNARQLATTLSRVQL